MSSTGWEIVAVIGAAIIGAFAILAVQRRKHDREDATPIKEVTQAVEKAVKAGKSGSLTELADLSARLDDFLVRPPKTLRKPLEHEQQCLLGYRLALSNTLNGQLPETETSPALYEVGVRLRDANRLLHQAAEKFRRTR
ncbi:hypothetical protein ACIOD1_18405 [Streptomyces sp. NPDC088097]|uniref:hypothetical protein n=1 Tax=Streptomyces sp. NPDC088097 TaxID=3365823 RepID=UPI00380C3C29